MVSIPSLFGFGPSAHDRALEIADQVIDARIEALQARNIDLVTPSRRTLDEIGTMHAAASMSAAGQPVTWETALHVTAVNACVRLHSHALAQPSWNIFKVNKNGIVEEANDHPLFQVLSFAPNPQTTSFDFRETMSVHKTLTGGSFSRIVRSGNRIVALWQLDPRDVTVNYHSDRSITYDVAGDAKGLTSRDIWHYKGTHWKDCKNLNPVHYAREAIGLSLATENYGSSLFKNGARPAGIVSLAGRPTKEQLSKAASEWANSYAGPQNANKTAFLGEDAAKYIPIASTADEAQWTESRQHQIEEICRAFGIRASMVMQTGATSYASVEQEFKAHIQYTVAPEHTRFEQSSALNLLTPAERKAGYRIKINTNALLRGSTEERMKTYQTLVTLGGMTINEMRVKEDLPKFEGKEFDKPRPAQNVFGKPDAEQAADTPDNETADKNDNKEVAE